jgi:hypothetical protein
MSTHATTSSFTSIEWKKCFRCGDYSPIRASYKGKTVEGKTFCLNCLCESLKLNFQLSTISTADVAVAKENITTGKNKKKPTGKRVGK